MDNPKAAPLGVSGEEKSLAFDHGGTGTPLLFIHGFGSSKFTWRHISQGIDNIHSYYSIDLPGSGNSPVPDGFSFSLGDFADSIISFISERDLRNVTLVAHSLGAGVAFLALLRGGPSLSSRITSMCIVDGICYPQRFPFYVGLFRLPVLSGLLSKLIPARLQVKAVLKYCYYDASLISTSQIEGYTEIFSRRAVRQVLRATARAINQKELSVYIPLLKSISVPCLLIWGDEDRVVPLKYGKKLLHDLPVARMVTIEHCGHMPQEECPDAVIRAIRDFEQARGRENV